MAKRRTLRKRSTTAKRGRSRKMNGTRRPARRRMNGAGMESAVKTVVGLAVGAIAGGVVIGMSAKLAPNFYVRTGGAAVLGLVIAKMAPKFKEVGYGVSVAGLTLMGTKALVSANVIQPETMNAASDGNRRQLTAAQMQALTARLKSAGALNGTAGTLNATPDGRAVITGAYQMFG